MNTEEFLRLVWPSGSHYFAVEAVNDKMNHHHLTGVEDAAKRIKWRDDAAEGNLYYAMASFKEAEYTDIKGRRRRRTQDNADRLKCFWIDLDCKGKESDYPDQVSAAKDILRLCAATGMPNPTLVVNSGYGLHAYWVLEEDISAQEWTQVANRWRSTLDFHGVKHDPACTTDSARILRPVGTHNRKLGESAREVVVVGAVRSTITLEEFSRHLVGANQPQYAPLISGMDMSLNDMAMSAVEYRPSSIKEVVKNCGLIREIGVRKGDVSEPVWHRMIGVVKFTTEAAKAIHFFSNGHPGYDHEATIAKAAQWSADPTSCEELRKVSAGELPDHCQTCQHRGSVKGPLQLGYEKIMMVEKAVVQVATGLEERVVEVAALPPSMDGKFKWERNKLWKSVLDKDATKTAGSNVFSWEPFCEFLFYPTGHYRDAEEKHQMIWTVREREGVYREFVLSGGALGTGGQPLFRELGENGVTAMTGGKNHMEAYLTHWGNELKKNAAATETFMRFGWHGERFLLGDEMFKPDGTSEKVKVGGDAANMVQYLTPNGDLDTWKRLMNDAYNHQGMEPYQFIIGLAFGSVLMPFMNVAGGAIASAVSYSTGQGKTTAMRNGFGIYGCPEENTPVTLSRSSVTHKGIFAVAGILHNLPVLVDEMTNIEGREVSDIVYTWSQGQPRIRLVGTGELAPVGFGWSGVMLTSSNKPMTTIIASAKPGADAELARLVEFDCSGVRKLHKETADPLFKALKKQYGVAGRVYVQWLVSNLPEVKALLEKTQVALDRQMGFSGENRFWSAAYTVGMVGLIIAKKLGLISYDLQSVMDWCVSQVKDMKSEIVDAVSTPEENFSRMLNELSPGIIVTDIEGGRGSGGKEVFVIKDPIGKYTGRAMLTTGIAYLSHPAILEWCGKYQVDPKAIIKAAHEKGWVKSTTTERRYPGRGTNYAMGQVRCLILDWAKLENSVQASPQLAEVVHRISAGGKP